MRMAFARCDAPLRSSSRCHRPVRTCWPHRCRPGEGRDPCSAALVVIGTRRSTIAQQMIIRGYGSGFRRGDTGRIAPPVRHTFALSRHESPEPCSSTWIRGQNDGYRFAPPLLPVSHHLARRRRRRITCVRRPGRLDQQQMHLFLCDRPVLDAFWHDVHLPGS
jgi:hypothetical protein